MKKFGKWFIGIILVLVIAYSVGPKVSKPVFATPVINLPASLNDLEEQINLSERTVKGIKPDNQARIIWADTSKKRRQKSLFFIFMVF